MKKRVKITYNAPVIMSFTLACFIVTIAGIVTGGRSIEVFFSCYRGSLTDLISYIRLISHVFGHVSIEHFLGNVMFLLLVGPLLEEKYGSFMMLKIIFAVALLTGVVHCILFDLSSLCGASGVVFACIVLSSFTAAKDGEIPLSFILVVALYLGKEVYEGIMIQDNISNLSHILGGFVGGFAGFHLNKNVLR